MERTGIDEAMIERLVRGFYAKVREDAVLGPIFEARIKNWEPHLMQMCAFWSSVALMTGRYHGTPMAKHLPLPIEGGHFDRWLALFEETAREICPGDAEAPREVPVGKPAQIVETVVADLLVNHPRTIFDGTPVFRGGEEGGSFVTIQAVPS